MKLRWPKASYKKDTIFSDKEFKSIFDQTKRVELCLIGSKLQIQVWKALLKIPFGKVISYTTLAKHIGKPKAVRTVATAIGKNPLCWLIPCHRVLRANGELGGYHWGLNVKKKNAHLRVTSKSNLNLNFQKLYMPNPLNRKKLKFLIFLLP